jgi:hypothetical protein
LPEVVEIVDAIAAHDAVLATGHISVDESFALLRLASERGVLRMVVTHASEPVPNMSVAQQKEAVAMGALIEHSLMATTDCCSPRVPWESFCDQLRGVGVENVVLSSDFGQPPNGEPVHAFGERLEKLRGTGFSEEEIRIMTRDNPRRLIEGRRHGERIA